MRVLVDFESKSKPIPPSDMAWEPPLSRGSSLIKARRPCNTGNWQRVRSPAPTSPAQRPSTTRAPTAPLQSQRSWTPPPLRRVPDSPRGHRPPCPPRLSPPYHGPSRRPLRSVRRSPETCCQSGRRSGARAGAARATARPARARARRRGCQGSMLERGEGAVEGETCSCTREGEGGGVSQVGAMWGVRGLG